MSSLDHVKRYNLWPCRPTAISLWLNHGTVTDSHSVRVNIKAIFNALNSREEFFKKQSSNESIKEKTAIEMKKQHKLIYHLCEFDYYSKAAKLDLDGNGLFQAREAKSHQKICNTIIDLLDPFLPLSIATDVSRKMVKCQICVLHEPKIKRNDLSFATMDYDVNFLNYYALLCTNEGVGI